MSWRGMEGGLAAIQAGHDVVFSPTSHCYFDYDYDQISLERTYSFEPESSVSRPENSGHVLGVQANMWTHLARTEEAIDQQLFPRLAALAEVAWSARQARDWPNFGPRMAAHYERLDRFGVKYRRQSTVSDRRTNSDY